MRISHRLRAGLAIGVLIATIVAFMYYLHGHPEVLRQIGRTNPWLLAGLLMGYGIFTVALGAIQGATLRLVRVRMPLLENLLLTSYSSIANFFGPLQSGPGVRLAYLKARYQINIKQYVFATFLYYGFFAFFSGLMLTVNVLPWWQTSLVLVVIVAGAAAVIWRKRQTTDMAGFSLGPVTWLAAATLFQVLVVALIYFAELRSVNPAVSLAQAITYTGAANFALFVSLTPGAIGFRESFLLFSERLHHIDSHQVLAASLLDRSANVLFLGLLFLLTFSVHAKQRFRARPDTAKPTD